MCDRFVPSVGHFYPRPAHGLHGRLEGGARRGGGDEARGRMARHAPSGNVGGPATNMVRQHR